MPLKTDALKRLEKWLNGKPEVHGWPRWMGAIDRPRRGVWVVPVYKSGSDAAYVGKGKTLRDAIHAALDAAEAPDAPKG